MNKWCSIAPKYKSRLLVCRVIILNKQKLLMNNAYSLSWERVALLPLPGGDLFRSSYIILASSRGKIHHTDLIWVNLFFFLVCELWSNGQFPVWERLYVRSRKTEWPFRSWQFLLLRDTFSSCLLVA